MVKRLEGITPFYAMDIGCRARRYPDAVHMELGEPDLEPSARVIGAYEKALRDRRFGYTPALGLMELRERIAEHYRVKYGLKNISAERVVITPGSSGAFIAALGMFLDAGQGVGIADPSYPCYKNFALFLNLKPVFIPTDAASNFEITPGALSASAGIAALIVSSPSNPTGRVYDKDSLAALVQWCERTGVTLISDEIYHGLVYGTKEHSALEFSDDAIVINGFSKAFCMTGLRVGWMIVPDRFIRTAEMLIQNLFISANTPAQYAACEAFDYPYLTHINEAFDRRMDYLYNELRNIVTIDSKPDGAFYLWSDVSRYGIDGREFSERLLEQKHVAVTPGIDFGAYKTGHFVRFAATSPKKILSEGVKRIKEFIETI